MWRWFEHFFILPLRWYRKHIRNWREGRQRCKVCGNADKFDFHIPDEWWRFFVPKHYQDRVVCLACFDDMVHAKGYEIVVDRLWFAGSAITVKGVGEG